MPANAALIAVMLVERPTCVECITAKAGLSVAQARRYLREIAISVDLQLQPSERCRTCGNSGPVYFVRRSAS
jgi:hypothetical protein